MSDEQINPKPSFDSLTALPKYRSLLAQLFNNIKNHDDTRIEEALDALDLAPTVEGDKLYSAPERQPGDDFQAFYDPSGFPLPGDIVQQAHAFEELRHNGENHFVTSLWGDDGKAVWVSTVYVGINHNFLGGCPPLIWETMLQSTFRWSDWQMRYCTKAAAQHGHLLITERLLALGMELAEAPGEIG